MIFPRLFSRFASVFIAIALALPLFGAGVASDAPTNASSATSATSGSSLKYLSGTGPNDAVQWDFFCTAGRRSGEWTKIRVPSCWEQEGFGTYYYGNWNRNDGKPSPDIPNEQGKYRTTFNVPPDWDGLNVWIVFAGVMTDAEVLVNGKSAGSIHQGGFYQFEYNISALLNRGGENTLEVNVSKESANISVNNAERRGDYWTFGGIYRPVWLEAHLKPYIERVTINARADGTFVAEVFRGGDLEFGGTVDMRIYDAQNNPVGNAVSAEFADGQASTTIQSKISNPLLWTAETPNWYRAEFGYAADTRDLIGLFTETYSQRFGFRTVEIRPGDGVYLNGQKIILKGVNRHSFRPETGRTLSREQCYDDARLIKEMNMNAVRMSHYPPDSAFLDACDELGLYVLDELAGWHGSYDTPTGARLAGEMVRRDVNHPSIIFWDNGNEGGWNADNDGEFAKWDPQRRNVLHPFASHDNINTKHYPKYDQLQKLCAGNEIYFPTEFLHGLYDGGQGAGFADYWRVMSASPVCAGGFFWSLADEGVARADEHGRIDNCGNLAPDGIVGPHHEREGSFYAVKEIWSPVTLVSGPDAEGNVEIKNNFAFTNLNQCSFDFEVRDIQQPDQKSPAPPLLIAPIESPNIAPGKKGGLTIGSPHAHDTIVYLHASDPAGRELWTWSWFTKSSSPAPASGSGNARVPRAGSGVPPKPEKPLSSETPDNARETRALPGSSASAPVLLPEGPQIAVHRGALQLRFDKHTGLLLDVRVAGKQLPISAGPALVAYIRDGRRFTNLLPPANGAASVSDGIARAKVTATTAPDGSVVIVAEYPRRGVARDARDGKNANTGKKTGVASDAHAGHLDKITWTIPPGDDAGVRLDYEYTFEGRADLLGVNFDVPENTVREKRWLGRGPYRVYRNRLEGGELGVFSQNYNDPLPGQTYVDEPEFKGYFRDWRWLRLVTNDLATITLTNNTPPNAGPNNDGAPYIGLWRPRDGVPMMMEFPNTSLTLLDVIPAQGSKFDNGDHAGPQAAPPNLSGQRAGSVTLHFAR